MSSCDATVVLAGFGSVDRHDDAIGPLVAARCVERAPNVRLAGPLSDCFELLGEWDGASLAVVVDAVRSGRRPGAIHVIDVDLDAADHGSDPLGLTSTHGLGLSGTLRLARELRQGPQRLVVVGVEGERFDYGEGLTTSVAGALPRAVEIVLSLITESASCA